MIIKLCKSDKKFVRIFKKKKIKKIQKCKKSILFKKIKTFLQENIMIISKIYLKKIKPEPQNISIKQKMKK